MYTMNTRLKSILIREKIDLPKIRKKAVRPVLKFENKVKYKRRQKYRPNYSEV